MSFYQQLVPQPDDGAEPVQASEPRADSPPMMAGVLRAAGIGLILCSAAMGFLYVGAKGEQIHLIAAIAAAGSALTAWAGQTIIVLLWRIARAAEKGGA